MRVVWDLFSENMILGGSSREQGEEIKGKRDQKRL
jgi:hypothetical protein